MNGTTPIHDDPGAEWPGTPEHQEKCRALAAHLEQRNLLDVPNCPHCGGSGVDPRLSLVREQELSRDSDRNPEGEKPEEALSAEHESAVPKAIALNQPTEE